MKNFKLEISGQHNGTALPTAINGIVRNLVDACKAQGLNVEAFTGNLDGTNVNLLQQAGIETAKAS